MKALELEEGLILKEKKREIDREQNLMGIILGVRIKYNSITTEELKQKETDIPITIEKNINPQLWKDMKDISIEDLMQFLVDNKDFEYFQTDETKTEENEEQFKYLQPFYNTVFPYLKQFDNIKIIDI